MKSFKLVLNFEKLNILTRTLGGINFYFTGSLNIEEKREQYILFEVQQKLLKKLVDKQGTTKDFNVNLKYYQALSLYIFLQVAREDFGFFEQNVLLKISNDLHQML